MATKAKTYPAKARELNEALAAKSFQGLYLICGEEAYLRKSARDRIVSALTDGLDAMNVSFFEGPETSEEALIDLAETMPFFADYRVIVATDTGLFKAGSDHPLSAYVSGLPDTVHFVFTEAEVDRRGRLFKEASKAGFVLDCETQDEETLAKWVGRRLKDAGRAIRVQDVQYLLNRVGTDMNFIAHEVDKLIDYTAGRSEVTVEDIDDVCANWLSGRIFDMTDAIAEGRQHDALSLYYDLLSLKEPPVRILTLITRQFNLMLQVKEMQALHTGRAQAASALKLSSYVTGLYEARARRYSVPALKRILTMCVEQDEAIKNGTLNPTVSVEMAIIGCTAQSNKEEAHA